MGIMGIGFLGTIDNQICADIAKEHKLDVEVVKKAYAEMLKKLNVKVEE